MRCGCTLGAAKRAGPIRAHVSHIIFNGGILHLHYADDTIIMVELTNHCLAHLEFLLLCFEALSGLNINFAKSEVTVMGYSEVEKQRIANQLNCQMG